MPYVQANLAKGRSVMIANGDDRRSRVVELSRQGMSAGAIADILGITPRSVCRARARAGISKPRSRLGTEDDKLRAKEMLVDGASYEEVGRTLGFAAGTIQKWHRGFTYTPSQVAHAAVMSRKMRELDKRTKNGLVDC